MQMLTNFNGEFVNELLVEGCSVEKRLKILGANLVANVAGDKSCVCHLHLLTFSLEGGLSCSNDSFV